MPRLFDYHLVVKFSQSAGKEIFLYLFTTDEELLGSSNPDEAEPFWVKKGEVAKLLTHPKDREFFLGVNIQI